MLQSKDENWTGDEPVEHAVLRMLVDKYKPMRSGPIRTAEEKLRQAPPPVRTQDALYKVIEEADVGGVVATPDSLAQQEETPVRRYAPGEPILPGIPGHQPWHTTFTERSHAASSVRYGNIPPPRPAAASAPEPVDDKARRKERETKRRMQQGVRLSQARESTLDYRLGLKGKGGAADQFRRPNPVSLKGWASLVEDRIEVRLDQFYTVSVTGIHDMSRKRGKRGSSRISRGEGSRWPARLRTRILS